MNCNVSYYMFKHFDLHQNIFQIHMKHIARRDCAICLLAIYFINYMHIGSKIVFLANFYLNTCVTYVSSDS
jgi:hypothetical protein